MRFFRLAVTGALADSGLRRKPWRVRRFAKGENAVLRNAASDARTNGTVNGNEAGVSAGESRPQTGGRFVDSLREAALVWSFDAGRLHTRLAHAALRALGGDAGVGAYCA
ncbi:MAG: hypothetical protein IT169_04775 [Bryobacterales bacterium]|nr:hypothetical protein [Bryobacterales bacterium]